MFMWLRSEVVSIYQPFQVQSATQFEPCLRDTELEFALCWGEKQGEALPSKVSRILAFFRGN
jgi:hypothetical protein